MKTKQQINNQIKKLKDKLPTIKGTECETYTRIVGYYRPYKSWNDGKKEEYINRVPFKVPKNEIKL